MIRRFMIAKTLSRAHAAAKSGRVAEARQAMAALEPYAHLSDELRRALGMLYWLTGDAGACAREHALSRHLGPRAIG